MRVILREDVPNLGKRGEVVKVADGYARNFLVPRGLAYRHTDGVGKQVAHESRTRAARDTKGRAAAELLAGRLKTEVFRFVRKVGETGSLFGSVTAADISAALAVKGFEVDKRDIRLDEPLKRPGTFRIPVHLFKQLTAEMVVEVEPEEAGPAS